MLEHSYRSCSQYFLGSFSALLFSYKNGAKCLETFYFSRSSSTLVETLYAISLLSNYLIISEALLNNLSQASIIYRHFFKLLEVGQLTSLTLKELVQRYNNV